MAHRAIQDPAQNKIQDTRLQSQQDRSCNKIIKAMSEEEEQTFAEAFAAVEARLPEAEATLLDRYPELRQEEQ
jgi:hypothetical protein